MDKAAVRILIVDDEPPLLKVMSRYLKRLGYDVVASSNTSDAWSRFEAEPSTFSLALVDMTMPGMTGAELCRKILAADHQVRLIACSGYPVDLAGFQEDRKRTKFLHKPFTPEMLAETVEELLGTTEAGRNAS